MTIAREIVGPQDNFERTGAQGYRDIRPLSARLSEGLRSQASGMFLLLMAGTAYIVPASATPLALTGSLYAAWVLTRRLTFSIRAPRSAGCWDYGLPDPATRRPRRAAGDQFIGNDQVTGQEIWITNEDGRQHGTIPGTTGAGKTTTIISFLANALAQGSGFVLVDGKANNELFGEVSALARRFGREDDVRVLNFMTASLPDAGAGQSPLASQSNTFNPFAIGNADAIRELIASQLGEATENDNNGMFRGRAVALLGTIVPVLVWMRDHKGVVLNIDQIRQAMELRSIYHLAKHKTFMVYDRSSMDPQPMEVPDLPVDILKPVLNYLGEVPGYNIDLPYNEQTTDKPVEQYGYALMYFTQAFTQLSVGLGHIFRVEQGDIDMRDIVLNRRILLVNLPALENSEDSSAALGRIIVASLRGMMAQLLGARLEGDPKEIFVAKPGMGQGPFQIVFDELAYYVTGGMDRMLAMGRGLNIMFWLGFQELGGIEARLGARTSSLLGNANLTVAMRQQDSDSTREWLEKTAGQTYVTQAVSYHGSGDGAYREAQSAELRQVSRVDWQDLQRMIEGEAIILFGGRRIYAKVFHAALEVSNPLRLNRPLVLSVPSKGCRDSKERIKSLTDRLTKGDLVVEIDPRTIRPLTPGCPILQAFQAGFSTAAAEGLGAASDRTGRIDGWINAGLAAAEAAIVSELRLMAAEDGPIEASMAAGDTIVVTPAPVTEVLPMMHGREQEYADFDPQAPVDPISTHQFAQFVAIERLAGVPKSDARINALAVMGEHDAAAGLLVMPAPPAMDAATFASCLRNLNAALGGGSFGVNSVAA